ncbi:MAG: SRPBCC family protein [Bacteroidales bacterium]|jgi:effector-binding domain-containing protein|nr:SRPBCC family protein [Bacteroidales bacterium]
MRLLKFIGLVLLFFLAVALVLPAILPKNATTSQSVQINAKAPHVFRLVNKPENWRLWSPFELDNPEMTSFYEGPEQGEGASHRWESENMGNGSMLILKSEAYEFIQSKLDFGNNGLAIDEWQFKENEAGVEVTWTLNLSELSYPFGKYFGFFLDGLMNPMQEKGLKKLKEIAEAQAALPEILEKDIESLNCLAIADSVSLEELPVFITQNSYLLEDYFRKVNLEVSADKFVFYQHADTGKIWVTLAFPVYEEAREYGKIISFKRPAGKVIQAVHQGEYNTIESLHDEMQQYLRDHELPMDVPCIEQFVKENDTTRKVILSYYTAIL